MKNSLFIMMVMFASVTTFGQNAKGLLDKVKSKYNNATTYYIKFDFDNGGKTTTGEVFTAKQKFNLNVMDINQIYDGKKLYTVSKDDKEVVVSNSENVDDLLTPTKILNSYATEFDYSLDKKQTIGGKTIQYIKLTPKKSNKSIKYALLGINTSNNEVYQYKEVNSSNQTTTITVKEYLENLIIHKTYFNFDANKYKSKGYIITQL